MEEMVTITRKEYVSLEDDRRRIQALESAGVDNWHGYDYAMEILREIEEDEGVAVE